MKAAAVGGAGLCHAAGAGVPRMRGAGRVGGQPTSVVARLAARELTAELTGRRHQSRAWGSFPPTPPPGGGCRPSLGWPRCRCGQAGRQAARCVGAGGWAAGWVSGRFVGLRERHAPPPSNAPHPTNTQPASQPATASQPASQRAFSQPAREQSAKPLSPDSPGEVSELLAAARLLRLALHHHLVQEVSNGAEVCRQAGGRAGRHQQAAETIKDGWQGDAGRASIGRRRQDCSPSTLSPPAAPHPRPALPHRLP